MAIGPVVTLGYSISGGLQAGPYTLPTLGYGVGEAVETKQFCVVAGQVVVDKHAGQIAIESAQAGKAGCC